MTAPMIYNGFSVVVTPSDLTTAAINMLGTDPTRARLGQYGGNTIGGWIGDLIDCVKRIDDAVVGLKLGWAGQTADEAQAFSTRWQGAMQKLFGAPGDEIDGTLSRVAMAIGSAGKNYDQTEDGIGQMLKQLVSGMQPAAASGDDTAYIPPPGNPVNQPWQGAVSETF